MGDWSRKVRSVLTLSGIGAAVTGTAAGIWSLVSGALSGYLLGEQVLANVVIWAFSGGFTLASFATALAALPSDRRLRNIGLFWSALVGGVAGTLAPILISLLNGGSWRPLLADLPVLGVFAALGAGLTTGLLAVAPGVTHRRIEEAPPTKTLGARD